MKNENYEYEGLNNRLKEVNKSIDKALDLIAQVLKAEPNDETALVLKMIKDIFFNRLY